MKELAHTKDHEAEAEPPEIAALKPSERRWNGAHLKISERWGDHNWIFECGCEADYSYDRYDYVCDEHRPSVSTKKVLWKAIAAIDPSLSEEDIKQSELHLSICMDNRKSRRYCARVYISRQLEEYVYGHGRDGEQATRSILKSLSARLGSMSRQISKALRDIDGLNKQ